MKKIFLYSLMILMTETLFAQSEREILNAITDTGRFAGANAVTVYDSTDVYMEESGLSYVQQHKLTKILSYAGALAYNTVKMDYDPLSSYVEIREIKIHHTDGRVEISDNPVSDYPAPAHMIFWGARQKMVTLGRLVPGDAVEVKLFRKGFTYALLQDDDPDAKYIPPMRGHFYDIVPFWSGHPVLEKVYRVNVLKNKHLQYDVYHGTLEIDVRDAADGRMLYTFSKQNIMPLHVERYTLSSGDIQTKLLLSTAPNWQSKSLWFYGVNEDYGSFVPTKEAKQKVHELVKKAKTEIDSIAILTHWVADNIRYSGISMGKGEGYTLHNCDMNFTDRCGVCKDKAGMLIAMLRAAGFESYAAMTMAGSRIDRIPADQFNHCVTIVKRRNGQYQLLDPTWVSGVRELWSSAEQQQQYLMGVPEGADLAETPISNPENHYVYMTAKTKLNKKGTLSGTVTVTAEGQSDRTVRALFYGRRSEWQQRVENQLFTLYPNAILKSVKYTDEDNYLKQPVRIVYHFAIPDYAVIDDNTLLVTPFLAKGFFKFAMNHLNYDSRTETREYPFADRCSRLVKLDETLQLPPGYKKTVQVPHVDSFRKTHIAFDGGYDLEKTKVKFTETVSLGKRIYEAADWPDYRTAILNQRYYMDTPLILSK